MEKFLNELIREKLEPLQNAVFNLVTTYMEKIAIGGGYPEGLIDLDKSAGDNMRNMAEFKGVPVSHMMACVLDRPRHSKIISDIRETGARIKLITDGDVAGVMATADPETGVDIYMGTGGAPEGVLAAAALRCIGGQMLGRLVFRNDDERARAAKWGINNERSMAMTSRSSRKTSARR